MKCHGIFKKNIPGGLCLGCDYEFNSNMCNCQIIQNNLCENCFEHKKIIDSYEILAQKALNENHNEQLYYHYSKIILFLQGCDEYRQYYYERALNEKKFILK